LTLLWGKQFHKKSWRTERTLQKAADRVYRTPQAISTAIGKLTGEIGTPLLDRSLGRDLRPTSAGEALVNYARRLLSLRDEALATMEEIRGARPICELVLPFGNSCGPLPPAGL
jgi:DNA-binding transcriptional LysR family regulator